MPVPPRSILGVRGSGSGRGPTRRRSRTGRGTYGVLAVDDVERGCRKRPASEKSGCSDESSPIARTIASEPASTGNPSTEAVPDVVGRAAPGRPVRRAAGPSPQRRRPAPGRRPRGRLSRRARPHHRPARPARASPGGCRGPQRRSQQDDQQHDDQDDDEGSSTDVHGVSYRWSGPRTFPVTGNANPRRARDQASGAAARMPMTWTSTPSPDPASPGGTWPPRRPAPRSACWPSGATRGCPCWAGSTSASTSSATSPRRSRRP